MKKFIILLLFLNFPLILNAQWVQTALNPGLGYCLYSDGTTVYAGTNYGVYFTNDIGEPWFSIGPQDEIMSIITAGNNIIAGSGASYGIWITSNMGQTWAHPSGIDNQSVYSLCRNDNYLFAGTWGSGVFRSSDNGSSWQNIGLGGNDVEALASMSDTIFAGGGDIQGAKVYVSIDNGNSWDYRYLPYPSDRVYCFNYKDGKLFAGSDGLYSSTDFGNSWSLEYGVTFDSSGTATDIKMFKDLIVYDQYLIASIMFNSIWISSDNGSEWVSFNEGLMPDWSFNGLTTKQPYLWSLRESFGNAYRRPLTDLVTSINTEGVILPSDYVLYQNYPNPFNPTTKIKFTIPTSPQSPPHQGGEAKQGRFVLLKIYDVLGNEVATLVNEEKPAGEYEVEFNAEGLPSGIYFYQLQTGSFVQVRKMVLLR